jgi:hypothetical protein
MSLHVVVSPSRTVVRVNNILCASSKLVPNCISTCLVQTERFLSERLHCVASRTDKKTRRIDGEKAQSTSLSFPFSTQRE